MRWVPLVHVVVAPVGRCGLRPWSGVRPDSRVTFFCVPKRKSPKKRAPCRARSALNGPPSLRSWCHEGRQRTRPVGAQTALPDRFAATLMPRRCAGGTEGDPKNGWTSRPRAGCQCEGVVNSLHRITSKSQTSARLRAGLRSLRPNEEFPNGKACARRPALSRLVELAFGSPSVPPGRRSGMRVARAAGRAKLFEPAGRVLCPPSCHQPRREVRPFRADRTQQGALSFGSFSLGTQRKGTRLSGRTPDQGRQAASSRRGENKATQ